MISFKTVYFSSFFICKLPIWLEKLSLVYHIICVFRFLKRNCTPSTVLNISYIEESHFLNIIYSLVGFNFYCTLSFFNSFCPHGSSALTNINFLNSVRSHTPVVSTLWFPILAVAYIIQYISVYFTTFWILFVY